MLALAPARAQAPADPATLAEIAAELDAARAAFNAPGLSVAIVAEGRVLMAQGFGARGLADPAPVDADTRFAIASCTKAFTALGLAMIASEGKLRFTDPVALHDPQLRLPDPAALQSLTVADLVTQRSGLARHDFLWHAHPEMSRATFAAIHGDLQMQRLPGTRYGYTNSGVILAGRLIELKTGQSWEDFTRQRIFAPLGMARANFSAAGLSEDANAAEATKRAGGVSRTVPWRDARLLGPAGAINASANDMSRWLLFLTQNGAIDGRPIVPPGTLNALFSPNGGADIADDGPEPDEVRRGYAFGWRVDQWRGLRRVSHSGAIDGFRARVTLFPERGLGVAVMTNLGPSQLPDFASRMIAERLLGLDRKTSLQALAEGRRAAEAKALGEPSPIPRGRVARLAAQDLTIPPSVSLSRMAGIYTHPAYGEIRIEPSVEGSMLRITFGQLTGRLTPWRGDAFIAFSDPPDDTLDEAEIVFRFSPDTEIVGLTALLDNDIAPIAFAYAGPIPPPPAPLPPTPARTTAAAGNPLLAPQNFAVAIGMVALLGAAGIAARRRREAG